MQIRCSSRLYSKYKTVYVVFILLVCLSITLTEAARKRKERRKKAAAAPYWKKNPPKIHRIIAREDTDVKLSCAIKGHPKPQISWLRNGRPVPENNKKKFRQRRGKFIVRSVDVNDIGKYTCIAENRHGQLNFTYIVSLLENQAVEDFQVTESPKDQIAHIGDDVHFKCLSYDWPRPTVHWARTTHAFGAMELLTSRTEVYGSYRRAVKSAKILIWRTFDVETGNSTDTLIVHNVTKADSGAYTCFISRDRVSKTLEATLTVIKEGERLPFEPQCSLHVRRQLMEDKESGCRTAEPVDVYYCMGSCGRSYYFPQMVISNLTLPSNTTCSCCQGIVGKLAFSLLKCPSGETIHGFYQVLRDCECRPCSTTQDLDLPTMKPEQPLGSL